MRGGAWRQGGLGCICSADSLELAGSYGLSASEEMCKPELKSQKMNAFVLSDPGINS